MSTTPVDFATMPSGTRLLTKAGRHCVFLRKQATSEYGIAVYTAADGGDSILGLNRRVIVGTAPADLVSTSKASRLSYV